MSSSPITTRADTGPTKAINFIGELTIRDPAMPLGAVLVLLYLYEKRDLDPGVTLRQLRADLGMNSTVATRSIYYWNDQTISVAINPSDRRGRLLRLAPGGEVFARKLEAIIA